MHKRRTKPLKEAKRKCCIKLGKQIEEKRKGNRKLFYNKVLETLRQVKPVQLNSIKSKDRKFSTKYKDIMSRCKEHYH